MDNIKITGSFYNEFYPTIDVSSTEGIEPGMKITGVYLNIDTEIVGVNHVDNWIRINHLPLNKFENQELIVLNNRKPKPETVTIEPEYYYGDKLYFCETSLFEDLLENGHENLENLEIHEPLPVYYHDCFSFEPDDHFEDYYPEDHYDDAPQSIIELFKRLKNEMTSLKEVIYYKHGKLVDTKKLNERYILQIAQWGKKYRNDENFIEKQKEETNKWRNKYYKEIVEKDKEIKELREKVIELQKHEEENFQLKFKIQKLEYKND